MSFIGSQHDEDEGYRVSPPGTFARFEVDRP